mmetsp:Transcript_56667/g.147614  ORF Transcript_56667/g.147614 Transcript_56667/m.147614 type:complete len:223 (-) Transcript_56667:1108-1776(-)
MANSTSCRAKLALSACSLALNSSRWSKAASNSNMSTPTLFAALMASSSANALAPCIAFSKASNASWRCLTRLACSRPSLCSWNNDRFAAMTSSCAWMPALSAAAIADPMTAASQDSNAVCKFARAVASGVVFIPPSGVFLLLGASTRTSFSGRLFLGSRIWPSSSSRSSSLARSTPTFSNLFCFGSPAPSGIPTCRKMSSSSSCKRSRASATASSATCTCSA